MKDIHTDETIAMSLIKNCQEWDIKSEKIITVVIDNASNMHKAVCAYFKQSVVAADKLRKSQTDPNLFQNVFLGSEQAAETED